MDGRVLNVIKRDGTEQVFDGEKIVEAVNKARIEVGADNSLLGEEVLLDIEAQLPSLEHVDLTVENIQDMVEVSLMGHDTQVAKAYVLYRDKRDKERKQGWNMTELQHTIWDKKYKYLDKEIGYEETFDMWLDRIASGNPKIRKLMQERKFLFGGRILSNRGLQKFGRKVTFSNCYVLPAPEDNIESIFETARDMARTYSFGGGVGISLRNLRPRNFRVNNNARTTSGAVSFMPLYSLTTETIGQNGRRGALMLSIPSSHPDLEEFIDVKTDLSQVTGANISVEIDDRFMLAVKRDELYRLHFEAENGESVEKLVEARKLYKKLVKNNLEYAEPGMLYWDTIERNHLMSAHPDFKYAGTNPCAEEPLPPGGSCLLGSINLSAFVKNPFTKNAVFSMPEYIEAIKESVVALNEVLDEGLDLHPLEVQKKTVKELRQIGLGVMGISDMLIKLGITYGSDDALAVCDTLASTLLRYSLISSSNIAKEQGSFEWYDWEYLSKSKFFEENVDEDVKRLIQRQGLRNSQILCIAPTGSISTMLGISGGIEPTFAFSFKRTTKSLHGKDVTYDVEADIVNEYREVTGNKGELPEYFIASHQLDWRQRIDMQSVWQKYIDASISSTINLGKDVTMDEVEDLYLYAWEQGLKGATIFHAGGKRAAILVSDDDKKEEKTRAEILEEVVEDLDRFVPEEKERATGFYSTCPDCGSDQMFQSAGCVTCNDCGFSPCS